MTRVFADASFFIALMNARDVAHVAAQRYAGELGGRFSTTTWVISEVAAFFARPPWRISLIAFLQELHANPAFELIHVDAELYRRAFDLYVNRRDKAWSLTDCVSFVVLGSRGANEALSSDDDFEQAGFTALLKPS